MTIHLGFLRAINVGGHTVTMAALRAHLEDAGCTAVESYIASGNVRLQSRRTAAVLEQAIERHLGRALGFPVATFLRSPTQVAAAVASLSAEAEEGVTMYIGLLRAPPDAAGRRRLDALQTDADRFTVVGREFAWLCRKSISQSAITGRQLESALGQPTTLRNLNTMHRVLSLWGPDR
jgi:uncharacterized protein (DUF1697 family)